MNILTKIRARLNKFIGRLVYELRGRHKINKKLELRIYSAVTQKKADLVEVDIRKKLITEDISSYERKELVRIYNKLQDQRKKL